MTKKGEQITQVRIGFEKINIALGVIYEEWYTIISKNLSSINGANIELGCGASFIDKFIKNIKKTDVFHNTNTEFELDALEVGNKFENKVSNLILVNVFHHISNPELFLKSAEKALLSNGRIIMIEPSNNLWSKFIYKMISHEKFDTKQIGWQFESNDPLFDSNQALSWIILKRDYNKFKKLFPMFSVFKRKSIMPFSYLISGGHSFNTGVGKSLIKIIRKIEQKFFDKYFGIFDVICIEKM